ADDAVRPGPQRHGGQGRRARVHAVHGLHARQARRLVPHDEPRSQRRLDHGPVDLRVLEVLERAALSALDPTPELIEAVVLWTGWGSRMAPHRDDARVLERFGDALGARLLQEVKLLEDEFYASDASQVAADLPDMGRRCSDDFRKKYP